MPRKSGRPLPASSAAAGAPETKKLRLSYDAQAPSQSGGPDRTPGAFVAHFSNSYSGLDSVYNGKHELSFNLFENTAQAKTGQRILIAENGRMSFIGTNYGKSSERTNPCKYMIGVHNRASGTVSLHDISHVYSMEQAVKGIDKEGYADQTTVIDADTRTRLIDTFGSKKKKQQLFRSR